MQREPRDTDESDDSGTPGVAAFNRIHSRESANLVGAAAGAAVGVASGGLAGGLAEAFLTPIAEAAGRKVAQALDKDDDEE
jgi:hypothetical protein